MRRAHRFWLVLLT